MSNRSGLIALSDGVRAQFQALGVTATVTAVGVKYRSFVLNQGPGGANRVTFMLGKLDPSSPTPPKVMDAGVFEQPKFSSNGGTSTGNANPRRLFNWRKLCSVSVWAVDTTDTANEELQLAALENLVEATFAAIHNAVDPVTGFNVGLADFVPLSTVVVHPPVESAFGLELVSVFEHEGPLYDNPILTVVPTLADGNPTREFVDSL